MKKKERRRENMLSKSFCSIKIISEKKWVSNLSCHSGNMSKLWAPEIPLGKTRNFSAQNETP